MTFSKNFYVDLLKIVHTTRYCDFKMSNLVKQNKGTTFFLPVLGHEIVGAMASLILKKGDWAFPYYRDRAFVIGFGSPIKEILAAFLARDIENHSGGRMMLDHFCDKKRKIACQSSCVGSQFLQAAGVAKGINFQKKDEVVYVSAGDGATSQGDFHEALNFSSIHKLPIVFVIQDNSFAISTPSYEQTAGNSIETMVGGYGLKIYSCKGLEIEKMKKSFEEAISSAREKKPSIVITKVPRLGAHTISDDPKKYKSEELIEKEKKEDPLLYLERYVIEKKIISKEELLKLKELSKKNVEIAVAAAEKIPFEKKEKATTYLFKDFEIEESYNPSEKEISMIEAINRALKEEMQRDENVLVFGQDVAREKGGVFGVTKGLSDLFKDRCFNTPLAESTIVGLCIGLSINGFIPVGEIQFSDFSYTGMNQLLNELSSMYYRSKGQYNCPVVIRMTCGGYIQGGSYHSQSLEGIFAHVPGLKIAIPSNALDAKRLLKAAIRDPNPVIFLEHKILYRRKDFCFRKESSANDLLPFGKAKIVNKGKDMTLVTWGAMVPWALEVIKELDLSIELIDIRTICPLDFPVLARC